MTLIAKWNLTLNVDDILRGQGADPQLVRSGKPRLMAMAERVLSEEVGLIHPLALLREVLVKEHRHERIPLEGGAMVSGPLVTRHLAGAQRLVAAVCTIGPDLEETVHKVMAEDPLLAMGLDGLGNAAVENLAQQVCGYITENAQADGLQTSTPLSPGNIDWPVEIGQPQIFSLLDQSEVGVKLTSGGMMIPKKSVSFIVGLGQKMSQDDLCDVCTLKSTCRYRRA